jgi:UDP-GlcNAc:undecaprenyl-phosphate GlcNAc-1-phosphate transferase
VLPADLSARGMLGDAGANPLGAVWGLGLAAATGTFGRIVTIAVLLVLNLASERWSFSAAIDRTPILSALDRLGRK